MSVVRRSAAILVVAGGLTAGAAAPAVAAPNTNAQSGLVSLNLQDTTVQVPVAVAANICNVAVNVLAQQLNNAAAPCDAGPNATATRPSPGGPNNNTQNGLVNVNIQQTTVQVPVSVAANICNVHVNALATALANNAATCTGTPVALATTPAA
jgi:hypothetical protein